CVAGFLAATSADQDGTRRAMLMNLVLGVAVLALGVGLGPFLAPGGAGALVVPVVVGWTATLVALARAARRHPTVPAGPAARSPGSPPGSAAVPAPVVRVTAPRPPSRWRGTAGVVAATMAVSLLAFVVVSRLPESSSAQDPGSGGPSGGPFGGGLPGGRGDAAPRSVSGTYSGGTLDLRARGDLPDTPVMLVAADSPTLWRSAVLDTYTGQTWAQTAAADGGVPVTGGVDVRTTLDPVPDGAPVRTDGVRWLAPGPFTMPRPGTALEVSLGARDTAFLGADGTLVHPHGGGGDRSDDEVGYAVRWAARPSVEPGDGNGSPVDAADLAAAAPATGPDGAGPVPGDGDLVDAGRWLQTSGTVTGRTSALARRLSLGADSRYAAVRAVEDHLRATTRYTLDAPVPGEDQDAVDDFLFRSKQGFCEQYATAEVVLLREMGIPARLAVGFSGGGLPSSDAGVDPTVSDGSTRLVRESDAHAWVEVWFPGVGWVASDPTAGSTLADPPALDRLGAGVEEHAVLLVVLAVVLALAVGLVVWLVVRRRRSAGSGVRAASAPRPVGGAADLLAAFDRLEAALDRTGGRRRPEETLAELGARLARGDERLRAAAADLPADLPADPVLAGAGSDGGDPVGSLAVLERLLYAATAPPAAELRAAASALDAVTARVLAAERLPEPVPSA
ncbi:MAG: transglutaminase domain-containing protein, partial [Actinobacteria bacterium]|nr:transglutaminase domain-containing protein [Actinomycetota bacterium]